MIIKAGVADMMAVAAVTAAAMVVYPAISWRRPPLAFTPSDLRLGRRSIPWDDINSDVVGRTTHAHPWSVAAGP